MRSDTAPVCQVVLGVPVHYILPSPAAAMVGVGAAFDFHAGTVPWAPAVLRRAGLEWAWRLAHEPARLWRRNLDSPLFVAKVLVQRLRRRQGARGPGIAV